MRWYYLVPKWVFKDEFHLKIWTDEPLVKWATGREDNTERVLCEIGSEYTPWICLMKCKLQWWAFVVGCWIFMEAIPLCLLLKKQHFFVLRLKKSGFYRLLKYQVSLGLWHRITSLSKKLQTSQQRTWNVYWVGQTFFLKLLSS
jgi:hypothetical protein